MTITLKKDTAGKFIPTPLEELLAGREFDAAETKVHKNEPFSNDSFLRLAIQGHQTQREAEGKV